MTEKIFREPLAIEQVFDYGRDMSGDVETTITTLRDAAQAMRSVTTAVTDEVRAIETAIQALQAAKCDRLAEIDRIKAHEADGASSISTWARRELRQDPGTTRQMVAAARTFKALPAVGDMARRGQVSMDHVLSFTYALKHIGVDETRAIEQTLLDWASDLAPSELHSRVRDLRDAVHPDELDERWRRGMDKRDVSLSRTLDGWVLSGFLDIEAGAKLKTILANLSVPRDGGDNRTASQRRMDALDQMCTSILGHGLPTDNGIKPHLSVTVEAAMLQHALNTSHVHNTGQASGGSGVDTKPATLAGWGNIGPAFLAHLLCGAEITPILIDSIGPNVKVLDVGDTKRFATNKQAKAISFRQRGTCASPSCQHPIAHNHHVTWISRGGRTDLDQLIGLCHRCHLLVHTEQLHIEGTYSDGYQFHTGQGSPLHQRAG